MIHMFSNFIVLNLNDSYLVNVQTEISCDNNLEFLEINSC